MRIRINKKIVMEITKHVVFENFKWIQVDFWKNHILKLHIKFPLAFYTWKICLKSFPGSVWVHWKNV